MHTTKIFKKGSILDLDKEYNVDRPTKNPLRKFLIECCKNLGSVERIACRYGITQDEYYSLKRILRIVIIIVDIAILAVFVSIATISHIYGQSNITDTFCVIGVLISSLCVIVILIHRKICSGLLFHAMNYDYVSTTII